MRIVQIANYVTPTSGGQRQALLELAARYTHAGHECTLVVPGARAESRAEGPVSVEQLVGVPVPASGGYRTILRRAPLRRLLVRLRPDVVELSDKTTLAWLPRWLEARGVPTVLLAHDRHDAMLSGTLPDWLPWRPVVRTWAHRASNNSAAVVCASAFCAEQFRVASVRRIPLGVDLDTFRPMVDPPAAEGTQRLVFVGRLSPEKRPLLAIAALRLLRRDGVDARLLIVGDGPLRREVADAVRGLPVDVLGHVAERSRLAALLAGSRVMVAPCATETFGLAVLEAMACGTPVVVPGRGAAQELLGPGTGQVVAGDGARALADAVLRVLDGDRAYQSQRCRARAEHFSWDRAAGAMLATFAEVCAAAPSVRTTRTLVPA